MLESVSTAEFEPPAAITVIDDDPLDRESLMDELRDYQIEPRAIDGVYGQDIDRLVKDVMALGSPFIICDHRLQITGFASFNGTSVIKRLRSLDQPAMLLTMFQSTSRMELRAVRADVPVVVSRDVFDLAAIGKYANVCRRELSNEPVDERKPRRSLVNVLDVRQAGVEMQYDVLIPTWRPDHAVTIPKDCIDSAIIGKLKAGSFLLGDVNIDAPEEDDLFFKNLNELVDEADLPAL
jgi:hypothetical protein